MRTQELGLENAVKVIQGNFFNICIGDADVATLFPLRSVNAELSQARN